MLRWLVPLMRARWPSARRSLPRTESSGSTARASRQHGARALPILLVDRLRFAVAIGRDHVVGRFDKLLLHHLPWPMQKQRRRIALGKFRPSGPDLVGVGQLFGFDLAFDSSWPCWYSR